MTRLVRMDGDGIKEAAGLVLAGLLVAYPTDTVYGLGCNPFDSNAVDRLVKAKERFKGSLPILLSSFDAANRLGEMTKISETLARKFWPGPLTIVVRSRTSLPIMVTDDSLMVGLRIPNHDKTRSLIHESGGSIIGTSANISGRRALTTAEDVARELEGRIDLVVDGGPAPLGRESTVVKVVGDKVIVVREAAISRDDILKALLVTRGSLSSEGLDS